MTQTLSSAIQTITGIQDPVVLDVVTGCLFTCGILLIVSIICKSFFRFS